MVEKLKIFESLDGVTSSNVKLKVDDSLSALSREFLEVSTQFKKDLSDYNSNYISLMSDIYENFEVYSMCRLLLNKVSKEFWPEKTLSTFTRLALKYDFDNFVHRFGGEDE